MQCVFSMAITALDDLGTVNIFSLNQAVNVFIKHIQKDFPCMYCPQISIPKENVQSWCMFVIIS